MRVTPLVAVNFPPLRVIVLVAVRELLARVMFELTFTMAFPCTFIVPTAPLALPSVSAPAFSAELLTMRNPGPPPVPKVSNPATCKGTFIPASTIARVFVKPVVPVTVRSFTNSVLENLPEVVSLSMVTVFVPELVM